MKTVRCVLMDEQVFLNFRGKGGCTVFLFCFHHFFLSIDAVGVSTVIRKLFLVLLQRLEPF